MTQIRNKFGFLNNHHLSRDASCHLTNPDRQHKPDKLALSIPQVQSLLIGKQSKLGGALAGKYFVYTVWGKIQPLKEC